VSDVFGQINGVRIAINIAVGSENSVADWGPDAVIKIQTAARDKLLRFEPFVSPDTLCLLAEL